MRRLLTAATLLGLFAFPTVTFAQDLALKRVMLSSGGLGYFEYEANVEGDATLKLTVALEQVDDVLKSLVVYDDKGTVGGVDVSGTTIVCIAHVPGNIQYCGDRCPFP